MRTVLAAFLIVWGGSVALGQDKTVERIGPPYPDRGLKGTVSAKRLPVHTHPMLTLGGQIWDANCRICPGTGSFGAPKITGSRFWATRLPKGIATLISHAQNGFETSQGGLMPARGGNTELTDQQVEAAVRFMVFNSGGVKIALEGLD